MAVGVARGQVAEVVAPALRQPPAGGQPHRPPARCRGRSSPCRGRAPSASTSPTLRRLGPCAPAACSSPWLAGVGGAVAVLSSASLRPPRDPGHRCAMPSQALSGGPASAAARSGVGLGRDDTTGTVPTSRLLSPRSWPHKRMTVAPARPSTSQSKGSWSSGPWRLRPYLCPLPTCNRFAPG